jgi:signal-transduction protein with cAMP-binding, CBS, and nucleotidyltransferase domain
MGMKPEFYRQLTVSMLFKGQTADEIQALFSRIPFQIKTYKKGNTLAFRGDPCQALILILKGTVTTVIRLMWWPPMR